MKVLLRNYKVSIELRKGDPLNFVFEFVKYGEI